MTFRLSILGLTVALAAGPWASPQVGWAQTASKPPGRPIEFSEPRDASTNRNILEPGESFRLEEELSGNSKVSLPNDSLTAIPAPTIRHSLAPAIQNKRLQQLLEQRRKDWLGLPPNEFLGGSSSEELFNPSDKTAQDRDKDQKLSPEQYYRNLQQKQSGPFDDDGKDSQALAAQFLGSRKKTTGRTGKNDDRTFDLSEDPLSAGRLKEAESGFKRLFENDSTRKSVLPDAARGNFDIFALGDKKLPDEEALSQKQRSDRALEDFKQRALQLPPTTLSSTDPIRSLGSLAEPKKALPSPLPVAAQLPVVDKKDALDSHALDSQFGLLPPLLPDPTAKAFAPPDSILGTPLQKLNQPPTLTPPVPTFTAPRRAF